MYPLRYFGLESVMFPLLCQSVHVYCSSFFFGSNYTFIPISLFVLYAQFVSYLNNVKAKLT